ncbi:hypothetical protein OIU84_019591 [Salix udensis]|uniref:Uncharacterized protein n=1 Tax=Salix udensis TaxID=889485 RepID=A0AAD6KZE9_9ROSI|nr:hypothetical protein OIU84_019591 [Salix udensis]
MPEWPLNGVRLRPGTSDSTAEETSTPCGGGQYDKCGEVAAEAAEATPLSTEYLSAVSLCLRYMKELTEFEESEDRGPDPVPEYRVKTESVRYVPVRERGADVVVAVPP